MPSRRKADVTTFVGPLMRSAEVAVGYAADSQGNGIAFVAIATGYGRAVVKVPFHAAPLSPPLDGREFTYAAVAAVGGYLRGRGFTRIVLRLSDVQAVEDLNARSLVPPALAMAYVKVRAILYGFALARVQHAEPGETDEMAARARAEVAR
jgi:hypothetical protein